MNKTKTLDWLNNTDGYTIKEPSFFEDILPAETIEALTMDHAGGGGKYAVNDGERILNSCVGVAEFDAISALAKQLCVQSCHEFYGRGRNFRETLSRCFKAIEELA